jgi:hypothetical protein
MHSGQMTPIVRGMTAAAFWRRMEASRGGGSAMTQADSIGLADLSAKLLLDRTV